MAGALSAVAVLSAGDQFDPRTASFAIGYHDEVSPYRDVAVVVMPRAVVIFNAIGGPPGNYSAGTEAGTLEQRSARQWRWTAPDRPGTYAITFASPAKTAAID